MYQLQSSPVFDDWIENLRDRRGRARILARLEAVENGSLGDVKNVGDGIHEIRIHFGPGYRIYFAQKKQLVILLLCGGDKSSQARDIAKARRVLAGFGKE